MSLNLLVVKPEIINSADKKLLRKNNILVIEANDIHDVKFVTPAIEGNCFDLLMMAVKALDESGLAKDKFNKLVTKAVLESIPIDPEKL